MIQPVHSCDNILRFLDSKCLQAYQDTRMVEANKVISNKTDL